MDTCLHILNRFRKYTEELTQNYGFDKKVAASLLCQSLFRSELPVSTEGNLKIAGKYFTDLLETTRKCRTTLRTCEELSRAGGKEYGYGLCRDMPYMAAGNLLIKGVVLITEAWYVNHKVDNINRIIEILQKSISQISKFLLKLSQTIRKPPHSPSNMFVYGIACLLISLICLYLLKYSK